MAWVARIKQQIYDFSIDILHLSWRPTSLVEMDGNEPSELSYESYTSDEHCSAVSTIPDLPVLSQ